MSHPAMILTSLILLTMTASASAAGVPLWVSGTDMGPLFNHVMIFDDVTGVTGATVTLNGTTLGEITPGRYSGILPVALEPGTPMNLVINSTFGTITATDVAPEPPALQTPMEAATFAANAMIPVTWTSTANPDEFQVIAEYSCGGGCTTSSRWDVDGTTRSLDVPANGLPPGTTTISVFSYEHGVFTGNVTPDSEMRIRGEGESRSITIEKASPVTPKSWGSVKASYR